MPVGLHYRYRQPWTTARLHGSGVVGQPANDLMKVLLEYIYNGAVNGVEAIDALGEKCVIFRDHLTLIADDLHLRY